MDDADHLGILFQRSMKLAARSASSLRRGTDIDMDAHSGDVNPLHVQSKGLHMRTDAQVPISLENIDPWKQCALCYVIEI